MGIADFTLVLCLCGKKNKNLEPAEAEAVLTWDATYQGDAEDTETAMYQ